MPWSGDSDDDDDDDLFCVVSALTLLIRPSETLGSACAPLSGALCSAFMPWSGDSDADTDDDLFCVASALTLLIRPSETTAGFCSSGFRLWQHIAPDTAVKFGMKFLFIFESSEFNTIPDFEGGGVLALLIRSLVAVLFGAAGAVEVAGMV